MLAFKLSALALLAAGSHLYLMDGVDPLALLGLLGMVGIPFLLVGSLFVAFAMKKAEVKPEAPRRATQMEVIEVQAPSALLPTPAGRDARKMTYGTP